MFLAKLIFFFTFAVAIGRCGDPSRAAVTVVTWLWQQENARFRYTAEHVNALATAIKDNTTIPVRIACVTDTPEGIYDWIEVIPASHEFDAVATHRWDQRKGWPQCFRRLRIFAPDAGSIFGDRIISMDLDCLIIGNLDAIFMRDEPFLMAYGGGKIKVNGAFMSLKAGALPHVYNNFSIEKYHKLVKPGVGSDQGWLQAILQPDEIEIMHPKDGILQIVPYNPAFRKQVESVKSMLSNGDISVLFFPIVSKIVNQTHEDIISHGLTKYYFFLKDHAEFVQGSLVSLPEEEGNSLIRSGICYGPVQQSLSISTKKQPR